jgi:hypothetical protein
MAHWAFGDDVLGRLGYGGTSRSAATSPGFEIRDAGSQGLVMSFLAGGSLCDGSHGESFVSSGRDHGLGRASFSGYLCCEGDHSFPSGMAGEREAEVRDIEG